MQKNEGSLIKTLQGRMDQVELIEYLNIEMEKVSPPTYRPQNPTRSIINHDLER
jgi:hypothetical protein